MKDRQLLLAIMAQLEREKIVSIPQLAMLLGVEEQRVFDALEVLVFAYDAASIRLDLHDSYATLQMHGAPIGSCASRPPKPMRWSTRSRRRGSRTVTSSWTPYCRQRAYSIRRMPSLVLACASFPKPPPPT